MKMWRVMGNNLKRNTWCEMDKIEKEHVANAECILAKEANPESNFFVQDYEEARLDKLEKRAEGT